MNSEDEKPVKKGKVVDSEDEEQDHKKKGGKKKPAHKKKGDIEEEIIDEGAKDKKKGKKRRGDESEDDGAQQDEDEDAKKKGKGAKSKKEEVVVKPAPKKISKKGKRGDDSDEDDDGDSKQVEIVKKEDVGKKNEGKKGGKKKHEEDDDLEEVVAQTKKVEAPKKYFEEIPTQPKKVEASKKGGKKKNEDNDSDENAVFEVKKDEDDEDIKGKGGKKVPAKKSGKRRKDSEDENEMAEKGNQDDEEEDFKVTKPSTKKANEKAKKAAAAEAAKKLQAEKEAKEKQAKKAKKPSNNQFAAISDSEEEESGSDKQSDEEEVKPTKNAKKQDEKKANLFALSGDEDESEEKSDEEEDEEEKERKQQELYKKQEAERKRKEEADRRRQEEEEKTKAILEKKKAKKEKKKEEEETEDDVVLLLSQMIQRKEEEDRRGNHNEEPVKKADKEKQEAEEDDQEEDGKKISKNQLKKMKEKQKKEQHAALAAAEEAANAALPTQKKGKKAPVNKAAQAALEKLAKQQAEKLEQERREAEILRQEQEEQRLLEEEARKKQEEKDRIKANKKLLKEQGLLKTPAQLKKEAEEKLKKELFLKSQGIQIAATAGTGETILERVISTPSVDADSSTVQTDSTSAPKAAAPSRKKKIEKDMFGQIIKQDEKKEDTPREVPKVIELDDDDWESCVSVPVDPEIEAAAIRKRQEEKKAIEAEQALAAQKELEIEEAKAKRSKKEIAEAEKAERDAKKQAMLEKIHQGQKKNKKEEKKEDVLRSPIVCILGHVDTGKTTLLDKLRNTSVQKNEAGGITQQIGATYFPGDVIIAETDKCKEFYPVEVKAPGLLVIDTPGHESFANLRTRGSSLCDFAILVIDLMHGIEQQTLESLQLLRMRKTPFVIALNKIDRTYNWQSTEFGSSFTSMKAQQKETNNDFDYRFQQIITALAENSINAALYWDNPDPKTYFPIVPTSGITGEGIPDILSVVIKYTSMYMKSRMLIKEDQFNCTVMEVKKIDGLGVTIDAILVDGTIRQDDKIVLLGFDGPIKTKIRALLTPHPLKEMRVKGEYDHHEVIHASMGIKIVAPDLENAVAGSQLYLANTQEEEDLAVDLAKNDFDTVRKRYKLYNQGVGVAASTLGSLEALLSFLDKSKIPVSYVSVGPVSQADITKALKSVLADDPARRKKEYACMLVFDVKVLPDAQKYAEDNSVKIFTANIIYHLFDHYMKFLKECEDERKADEGKAAIFPCLIKPLQFFNKADPIIMGVDIERGVLRPGTPICIFNDAKLKIGVVESIESNKKSIPFARKETGSVAIRIKGSGNLMAGRQFTEKDQLVSILSRTSIDALKNHFRDEVTKDEWLFIKDVLKPYFGIL